MCSIHMNKVEVRLYQHLSAPCFPAGVAQVHFADRATAKKWPVQSESKREFIANVSAMCSAAAANNVPDLRYDIDDALHYVCAHS